MGVSPQVSWQRESVSLLLLAEVDDVERRWTHLLDLHSYTQGLCLRKCVVLKL